VACGNRRFKVIGRKRHGIIPSLGFFADELNIKLIIRMAKQGMRKLVHGIPECLLRLGVFEKYCLRGR